jgi:short-subunit dehydrogenase
MIFHQYLSTAISIGTFALLSKFNGGSSYFWPITISMAFGLFIYAMLDVQASRKFRTIPKNPGVDSVLVTGSSKGIGFHLAKCFARDGFNVVLVAENIEKLKEAKMELIDMNKQIRVEYIAMDLSQDGAAKRLFEMVTSPDSELSWQFRINHVVNNAADAMSGEFLDIDLDRHDHIIKLNIQTYTQLCHLFGNWWKRERMNNPNETYRLLNVSSIAAFQPGPGQTTYYASKAYIQSFTMALHHELRPYGIQVSAVCPGLTMTDFLVHANLLSSNIINNPVSSPAEVAAIGYRCLMTGKRYAIVGWSNYLFAYINGFLPYGLNNIMQDYLNSKKFTWNNIWGNSTGDKSTEATEEARIEKECETIEEFEQRTGKKFKEEDDILDNPSEAPSDLSFVRATEA